MNTQGAFHLHSHGDNGCLHAIICQDKLYLQLEAGGVLKLILFFHPHIKCAVFGYVFVLIFRTSSKYSKQASSRSAFGRHADNRTMQKWAPT